MCDTWCKVLDYKAPAGRPWPDAVWHCAARRWPARESRELIHTRANHPWCPTGGIGDLCTADAKRRATAGSQRLELLAGGR